MASTPDNAHDFVVRLPSSSPDRLSPRRLYEILKAVQSIVTHLTADEITAEDILAEEAELDTLSLEELTEDDPAKGVKEEPPPSVSLIGVEFGSAEYACRASSIDALQRLSMFGAFIENPTATEANEQRLTATKLLSKVADAVAGPLIIHRPRNITDVLATITPQTFEAVSKKVIMEGTTSIYGLLSSVGGAKRSRCAIRIPAQHPLVRATVDQKQAQQLGRFLYKMVGVEGNATWYTPTWRIIDFKVSRVIPYEPVDLHEARRRIRAAGGDAWDNLPDSALFLTGPEEDEEGRAE